MNIKAAFTSMPYCIATYVTIIGMIWLLSLSGQYKKNPTPVFLYDTAAAAETGAWASAKATGQTVFKVSGTGSMKPEFQENDFVVAGGAFADVVIGDVLVYRATWRGAAENRIIHRTVQKDSYGWIMSGDSAPMSESWARVTAANFDGKVKEIHRVK